MSLNNHSVALILLTWNAQGYLPALIERIREQSLEPDHFLVIDSSSTDQTQAILRQQHIPFHTIPQSTFDHGATRQLATQLIDADVYIFMTQDALPATSDTFERLIHALLAEHDIGCAYGRQLPAADANPLGAHLRLFNYPSTSYIRRMADKHRFGIKTCFNSNSFAAYKRDLLAAIGGFPQQIPLGEDVYVAAKLLTNGYRVAYAADATVIHSHNFSLRQEFKRYYAIGQFHRQESWITNQFNGPSREGFKYIASEIRYLIKTKQFYWLPRAMMSWVNKYLAYKLGSLTSA